MRLEVQDGIHLSEFAPEDREASLRHLNEREIYDGTLAIPFPYTPKDADAWIARVTEETRRIGRPVTWAIREAAGALIGGVGFHGLEPGKTHKAELGYWLAKPYWGRGIMTAVVARVCRLGFEEFGLLRITAHVFDFNAASARVLEKCGFALEGTLRKHHLKDGRPIDSRLYALVR